MLLVIDVGNTNITLGVFDKEELFGTFRMKTKQPRTSDEYGITLQELVERHGIESSKINAVIIASVVPVGAYTLYGGPTIVVDFGTATTFDVIGPDGTFEAGVIAPGIRTSAQSLCGEADMLPAIEIRKPKSILAKETITAMQAGLVYGQIGQTEYIIRRMKEESGYPNAKVVATGGLGKIIANETDMIDVYDSQLTLKGLRFIYEKNKKNK